MLVPSSAETSPAASERIEKIVGTSMMLPVTPWWDVLYKSSVLVMSENTGLDGWMVLLLCG